MLISNDDFYLPDNDAVKLWRYMDLPKFLSMLDLSALYFSPADQFRDPYEGTFPVANEELRTKHYPHYLSNIEVFQRRDELFQKTRKHTIINCWHLNEFESAAMWDIYANQNSGIAIQSTFGRFRTVLDNLQDEVVIGKVSYIDYQSNWMPEHNYALLYLHKRKSFEYEQEIRAIISNDLNSINKGEAREFENGRNIVVDIGRLVENIYLNPTMPQWIFNLIKGILAKYGFNIPLVQSRLYALV